MNFVRYSLIGVISQKKKLNVFNKFAWEVDKLKWFKLKDIWIECAGYLFGFVLFFFNFCVACDLCVMSFFDRFQHRFIYPFLFDLASDINERGRPTWQQERIRPFFDYELRHNVNWKDPCLTMLLEVCVFHSFFLCDCFLINFSKRVNIPFQMHLIDGPYGEKESGFPLMEKLTINTNVVTIMMAIACDSCHFLESRTLDDKL